MPDAIVPPLIASTVPLTVSISAPLPEACNFPGPVTLTLSSKSKVASVPATTIVPELRTTPASVSVLPSETWTSAPGPIVLPLIRSALPLAVSINRAASGRLQRAAEYRRAVSRPPRPGRQDRARRSFADGAAEETTLPPAAERAGICKVPPGAKIPPLCTTTVPRLASGPVPFVAVNVAPLVTRSVAVLLAMSSAATVAPEIALTV